MGAQAKRKNQASAGFFATQASLKKTNKTPNIQRKVIEYDKDDRLTKMQEAPTYFATKLVATSAGNLTSVENLRNKAQNSFDTAGRLVQRRSDTASWNFGYLPNGPGERALKQSYFSGKTRFLSENIETKYLRVIFTAFSSAL